MKVFQRLGTNNWLLVEQEKWCIALYMHLMAVEWISSIFPDIRLTGWKILFFDDIKFSYFDVT